MCEAGGGEKKRIKILKLMQPFKPARLHRASARFPDHNLGKGVPVGQGLVVRDRGGLRFLFSVQNTSQKKGNVWFGERGEG